MTIGAAIWWAALALSLAAIAYRLLALAAVVLWQPEQGSRWPTEPRVTLLKPLCGLEDEDLFTLAYQRGTDSLWQRLTSLNRRHMSWAWASLITVTLADVYVRLLALGIVVDPAIHL